MAQRLRPTLLIGLGQSGAAVCVRLVERLKRAHQGPALWRFLLIDRPPMDRHLSPLKDVGGPRLTVEWLEVSVSEGATRRTVWQAFASKAPGLYEQVGHIYAQITDLPLLRKLEAAGHLLDTHNTDVFLIAAVDEVVGGALFLDVAYLVRGFLHNLAIHERVKAFLLLPPAFDTDPERDARAYAALQELEFAVERSLFDRRYTEGFSVRVAERPFDAHLLLDATNERGQSFASREDLHGLVAELSYVWLTSPLGDEVDAALEPVRVPPRFAGGKMGAYGSVGLSGAWLPRQLLGALFARRWARSLLQQRLLARPASQEAVEEAWRRFLTAWPWLADEKDALWQGLARDPQGRSVLLPLPAPPFEQVPPEQLVEVMDLYYRQSREEAAAPAPPPATLSPPESLDPVERELRRLKQQIPGQVPARPAESPTLPGTLGEVVRANLEQILPQLETSAREAVRALLASEAAGAPELASEWVRRVEERRTALEAELHQRLEGAERQKKQWERELGGRRAALQEAVGRRPPPAVVLGRLLVGWGMVLSSAWAGLQYLVNRGWLLSPPLLVSIFSDQATGGEPVQTVLLGLLWSLVFVVQGMALAERRRRPLAQVRDAYLEAWQNVIRWRTEHQVGEAALVILQRLGATLQRSADNLVRFRQRLEQVASTLESEERALWDREMRLTFVTAEWVLKPEEWEEVYRGWMGEGQAHERAAVDELGPVHQWGQYTSADLAERLTRCGLSRLQAGWADDAEAFLLRRVSLSQALERLEGWYRAASPLLRYSTVHLRGEGEFVARHWLAVPEPARSPLGERARGYRGQMDVVPSGDPEWLRCLRLQTQMPLYALIPVSRCRLAYLQRRRPELHSHPDLENLPDLFPDSLLAQESPWHAWLVVGVGLQLVEWKAEGFFLAFQGYPLLLGRDTRESLDYLQTHPDVADVLYRQLQETVRTLGDAECRRRLQAFRQEAPLSGTSRESLDRFMEQDLPGWLQTSQEG